MLVCRRLITYARLEWHSVTRWYGTLSTNELLLIVLMEIDESIVAAFNNLQAKNPFDLHFFDEIISLQKHWIALTNSFPMHTFTYYTFSTLH